MRRSNGRVRLWATGLAGIVAAALPLVSVRHAMGAGTIPPPCGMTLVLAKASPGVVLNRPGAPTTVTLPMLVYLVGAVEFGGVDFCLSPPFQRTIDLTVTCDPGPGTTVSVPVTLNAGFNEVPVTVTLRPGPAVYGCGHGIDHAWPEWPLPRRGHALGPRGHQDQRRRPGTR